MIIRLEETVSTNDVAKELAKGGAPGGTVVVAECQTGGKGRFGRSWYSEKGAGLFFSMVLRPVAEPAFTLAAAVAVSNAVYALSGVMPAIKWPNDLLLNDRKLCGISNERHDGFIILGVGVNVNNSSFGGELEGKATSLFLECGTAFDKNKLLEEAVHRINAVHTEFIIHGLEPFLNVYKSRCINIGHTVTAHKNKEEVDGFAVDVSSAGELVIRKASGETVCVNGGEVSLRSIPRNML